MKIGHIAIQTAVGALLIASKLPASAGDIFTFAGFTFDQRNTPNQAARLGNSVILDGAQFSLGFATTTTGVILNFPQNSTNFDTALSLGQLSGLNSGLRAVNLPNGNDGTTTRHGLEVWWSGHRGLPNLGGVDLVIYESGEMDVNAVDGMMVRVRCSATGFGQREQWTSWYWYPPVSFQITRLQEGLFAFALDLSDLGVPFGATIDTIQMANLIQADRVAGPGTPIGGGTYVGVGKVVFDGSSSVLPDAGLYDADHVLDPGQWDPDPLYVAALQNVVPLPPLFFSIDNESGEILLGLETSAGRWRVESTDSLFPVSWQFMDRFTNTFGGTIYLLDSGQNGRLAPDLISQRFYRAVSE